MDSTAIGNGIELTETENELYDRQIRLWGLESQKRLRSVAVLISGLNGLGAEVAKNLILAGVLSVTLNDYQKVTAEDFGSQFLVSRDSLGKNRAVASLDRARKLNPMVQVCADDEALPLKDTDFIIDFDVVILIGHTDSELERVDAICREHDVKFFAGDVWGMFGYCFADLQTHTFVEDIVKHKVISKPNEKVKTELVTTTVQRTLEFPPYSAVLKFDISSPDFQKKLKRTGPAFLVLRTLQMFREEYLRTPNCKQREVDIRDLTDLFGEIAPGVEVPKEMYEIVFGQISPTAAIVGGVLSQEVIKAISRKEAPHRNMFIFDPETCCGFIETIGV